MGGTSRSGFCVTCLNCGRIHQKGFAADATFICPKCGYENYVFLRYGVQIEMPASKIERQQLMKRVQQFAYSLDQLARSEHEDKNLKELA